MPRLRIEARDLRVGDVLVPTGRVVVSPPTSGVRTKAGRVDLVLRRPNGQTQPVVFGRYTLITVARPSAQEGY